MDGASPPQVISKQAAGYGGPVLTGLKAFQRMTAEYVFDRLYRAEDSTRRFLIADEVGLGKTLVAAGVIAQAIDHLREEGVPRIDVIYICSNQAIARQNVDRIRHHLPIEAKPLAERITLLPYRLDTLDQKVNVIALTPGTSFNSASAEGIVEERIILYRMLRKAWGDLGQDARRVFLGGLRDVARFMEYESSHPDREIDGHIVELFRSAVKGPGAELHREFIRVRDLLADGLDDESWRQRQKFVARLRRLLAHACLDALEPDLVILDEFQRFRDLLNPRTTSGELAQRLFEYKDSHTKVRTLLLSATPYKMYTISHESDDDHYRDFLQTVSFLEGPDGSVQSLERSLRDFRSQLPVVASGGEIGSDATERLSEHRTNIQAALRRVMSRTERRGRAGGGDPMLHASEMTSDLDVNDVEAYLGARDIATAVDSPGVTEYWKSAPYLLSFMDRYRLADRVRSAVEKEPNGEIAKMIRDSPNLQLQRQRVERRRSIPGGNGRMRTLLRDLASSHLHHLLWLPPSLPEHRLGRDFERAMTATKRLVFSSWTMVPRAVAVMASHDAERHYIRERAQADRYRARLLPVRRDSYSLFALMTPSHTLAEAGDPLRHAKPSAKGLLRAIEDELRPKIDELTRNAPSEGPPQDIWYAVAPLLLDRESGDTITQWRRDPSPSDESPVWEALANRVTGGLANPDALGRPPNDLIEVLAALAAGSPANATLRALSRITSASTGDRELKAQAMTAAWAFRHLFRAPTSEGLLRSVYKPGIPGTRAYWRRVLAYALEGGLSAVLEEYFHVIREDQGGETDASAIVRTLCQALQLAAGTLEVTQWKKGRNGVRREAFTMRQHFARRYANDDQQANQHLDAVRAAFNSPFWPFVLCTTSIGQEGLDFHWYCHAVVHWNLPPNPVDLEQREGRVHRYHGHAIRKNIAQRVGARAVDEARASLVRGKPINLWESAYRLADDQFSADGGLIPHWVFAEGEARIQRHSPVLPLSRDANRLGALRRSLAVYRMVFGQPRQDDLLEFILSEVPEGRREDLAAALTIDLSPPS